MPRQEQQQQRGQGAPHLGPDVSHRHARQRGVRGQVPDLDDKGVGAVILALDKQAGHEDDLPEGWVGGWCRASIGTQVEGWGTASVTC